jgi:hypothetical protein
MILGVTAWMLINGNVIPTRSDECCQESVGLSLDDASDVSSAGIYFLRHPPICYLHTRRCFLSPSSLPTYISHSFGLFRSHSLVDLWALAYLVLLPVSLGSPAPQLSTPHSLALFTTRWPRSP